MYCYQCEQTAGGTGCTKIGVCGKEGRVADLQDVLIFVTKKIAVAAKAAAESGVRNDDVDQFVIDALFTTVTNVNFDERDIAAWIARGMTMPEPLDADAIEQMLAISPQHSVGEQKKAWGNTVAGLHHLVLFGLKGAAAYLHHAATLGHRDAAVAAEVCDVLAFLDTAPTDVAALLDAALQVGKINYLAMELLDTANKSIYGIPQPTSVRITPVAGKAILVSGHDLRDLESLLVQTAGRGINVYTHGEMLPCHGYPKLAAFPHLIGNYGGAWQDQRHEFDAFPGAIVMTTNCIQKPAPTYTDRIFTTGLVRFTGVQNIATAADGTKDWSPVIDAALTATGFDTDAPEKRITVGFGGDAILGVADKVVDAVKSGTIKHIFLVGGCDGAKTGRNYYTDFAHAVPRDAVILTLACGKYRFNKESEAFGDIGGIPRLLDVGQCNDAYSAIRVAVALAGVFGCGVNDLPLSLVLSWYEQKAVAILLTLLALDVRNIRLGPTMPAFLTSEAIAVLVERFGIKPITNAHDDIADILGAKL